MSLIQVDMICFQTAQAVFTRFADMVGGKTSIVRAIIHRLIDFCGKNDFVPVPAFFKPATDDFFRDSVSFRDIRCLGTAIDIGRIE